MPSSAERPSSNAYTAGTVTMNKIRSAGSAAATRAGFISGMITAVPPA
jgi:hypothetical protein